MVRIKVVHASHLLLGAAIVLLVVALAVVGALYLRGGAAEASIKMGTTQMVENGGDVEAAAVFAAASLPDARPLFDPALEDEHTDPDVSISDADMPATDDRAGFEVVILPRESAAPEEAPAPIVNRRVLIYHTHTNEAYEQVADDRYAETERWRTDDQAHSIVRVGEELAALLRGFGLTVVHDVTDHEPPKLGTAYARSLNTLASYAGEPFDLYIDLHRDAYDEAIISARAVSVGGSTMAQLMVLVGNGEGFDDKPDTERNLTFARALTERANNLIGGLMRPVLVKAGRYNQHVGTPAILIEVGHNKNTLSEALNSMPTLARAIAEQLSA